MSQRVFVYGVCVKRLIPVLIFVYSFFFLQAVQAAEPLELSGRYKGYNVILIVLDGMRPDHLGCYGYPQKTSPNIDSLADHGAVFTNAFSVAAYTLPGVASIFTSLYPYSHGMMKVLKDKLPDNVFTLAQVMGKFGYNTAWFGPAYDPHTGSAPGQLKGFKSKYHVNFLDRFDKIHDWIDQNSRNKFFLTVHSYLPHEMNFPFLRTDNRFSRMVSNELKDGLLDLRQRWWDDLRVTLNKDPERIYFLFGKTWVEYNMNLFMDSPANLKGSKWWKWGKGMRAMLKKYPQKVYRLIGKKFVERKSILFMPKPVPLGEGFDGLWGNSLEGYVDSLNKKKFSEFMSLLDSAVYAADEKLIGGIISELKALGIYDRTIIVITADHGNEYKEHGHFGHGRYLYDESIHIPLIYYLPGAGKGTRIDQLAQSIDILPTLLDLLSIPAPERAQGISLVGLLENKKDAFTNEFVFSQGSDGIFSLRSLKWKYIRKNEERAGGHQEVSEYLFDLQKDKLEKNNLMRSLPKTAKTLRERLDSWEKSLPVYGDEKREFLPGVTEEMRERIRKTGYW